MSHKSSPGSTVRPSPLFALSSRLFSSSRSFSSASAHLPSSPSGPYPTPLSSRHAASRPAEPYLSPISAYYHPSTSSTLLHASTNAIACHSPVLPVQNPQHESSPSTSKYHLEHYASTHRLVGFACTSQGPNRPSRPSTRNPYTDPTVLHTIHPLPNSQPLYAEQPSIVSTQLDKSVYQDYSVRGVRQQPLQVPVGPVGPASTQRGATYYGEGMFSNSQHFSVKDSIFIDNSTISDNFMKEFLQHTIIGAEYDSSARYPPPRCHPGTRLAIVQRCKDFIVQCHGEEKTRWIVGPAGVGKSAIMQMIAEETPADASVFLSVNGRQDGTKTFTTIAYQLAARYEPYRQFISKEIGRDPALLGKALPVQFQKFLVEPFIHQHLFHPSNRFVVIIDGLDECDNPFTQRELLELISDFCLSYPSSPIVWFVASRPEPHITSFFDDVMVAPAYTMEEIKIDSDEACEDVQRYLHEELSKIKRAYPTLKRKREWPSELEFTKIATAAGGLFAYASTVVRYIGDPHYGDPVSQLGDVLVAIDADLKDETPRKNNPLALLDALYERIVSKIPDGAMVNARKLLLVHSNYEVWPLDTFRKQCNRLGLTEDAAYGAVRHLHAVVRVPAPEKADDERLTYFHKSFKDFLFDFKRSKFCRNIANEVELIKAQSSLRIVEQVPDNFDGMVRGGSIKCGDYGYLEASPGFCDSILLSWPGDERFRTTDHQLRLDLYRDSMNDICTMFSHRIEFSWNMSCFQALTTRFSAYLSLFPVEVVRIFLFDKFRPEFRNLGKLKRVPLRALDYAAICGCITFQFTNSAGMDVECSDRWNLSCQHLKEDVDGLWSGWKTVLARFPGAHGDAVAPTDIPRFNTQAGKDHHWKRVSGIGGSECLYCLQRLARHFINNPDQLATVFVDSTEMCYVEVLFVDRDDGVSKWRYRFFHSGLPLCT